MRVVAGRFVAFVAQAGSQQKMQCIEWRVSVTAMRVIACYA